MPEISVSGGDLVGKRGGLTKKETAGRTWRAMQEDEVLGRSAQLAYFFLFAIFPLVIFLTALIAIVQGPNSPMTEHLIMQITRAMPPSAGTMLQTALRHSLAKSGNGMLAFGIVVALFSASSGMVAMMEALNRVFDVDKERGWVMQRFTAVWLTVVGGLLVCVAIFLITVGGKVAGAVAGGGLYWVWQIVQYPVAFLFLLIAFSVVYRFGPDLKEPRWRVFTPGSVTGLCLWLIASFGLRVYLHYSDSYTTEYGTMGTVMLMMLWFYVTALAFLIGGEVDAIIDRAAKGREKRRRVRVPAEDGAAEGAGHQAA